MLQNVCLLVINGVNPSTANLPNDFPTFHPLYLSRFTPTRTNHPPSQGGFPHLHNSLIEAWILLFYNNFCLPNNYLSIPSKNPSPISQLSTSVLKKYESELYKPEKKKEIHRNIHDGREFKPRSNRPSRGERLRIEEENPLPPLSLSSGLRIGFAFGDRVHVWLLIASDERLRSTRRERNRDGHIRCTYTHVHVHIRIYVYIYI